jgi:eukaryotic-like serine/threonine-protein kinase
MHMAKAERTCTRCGIPFASEKLGELCPACLIANTLDVQEPIDGPAFWEDEPPARAKPARTFSHFELLDELGRGGMGVVYRARDLNTDRIIALKVLQAHHLEVDDLVQRFRSEVRAVGSLDHPHVLPIHEVGEYEGIPFFSMKLTTGGSLAHNMGSYLGNPRNAAELLAKVSRGVQHAHERGILHRDLKPGNILLDSAGEPYVCDFGLAKWLEDDRQLTMTAAVLGTPHYIAPEQASGSKGLTTAVDIYSLGAILYELLTGRPPFVGGSVLETLVASQEKTPDRPSSLVKNVPRDLETICLKALQHDPANRYTTAGAFAEDLENWLAGKPIQARPVGAAEQLWRWAKRNPLPAGLVAILIITLTLAAVGSTLVAIRLDTERQRARIAEQQALVERGKAEVQLWEALVAEARAWRMSNTPGRRFEALEAIRKAAAIKTAPQLRTEVIAALTHYDLRERRRHHVRDNPLKQPLRFDAEVLYIYVADQNGDISIKSTETGETLSILDGTGESVMALLHSGTKFLAARYASGAVRVWNVATKEVVYHEANRPVWRLSTRWLQDFSFSRDESTFAVAGPDRTISIYRTENFDLIKVLSGAIVPAIIALDKTGNSLAVGSPEKEVIEVWNLEQNAPSPQTLSVGTRISCMAYIAGGARLAIAGYDDRDIQIHDLDSRQVIQRLSGHRQNVTQLCSSEDGQILISTSRDKTVRVWPLRNTAEVIAMPGIGAEAAISVSKDMRRIGATDFQSDAIILELAGIETSCTVYPSTKPGELAALVSSIDTDHTGKLIAYSTFDGFYVLGKNPSHPPTYVSLAPSKEKNVRFLEGGQLMVASRGQSPALYRVREIEGVVEVSKESTMDIPSAGLLGTQSSQSRELVCLTNDESGKAVLFDVVKRKIVLEVQDGVGIWDVALDPGAQWIATSFGRGSETVKIWSLKTGKVAHELPVGVAGILTLSPDGGTLITSGTYGGRLWDTKNWSSFREIDEPSIKKDFCSSAYSPQGELLAVSTTERILLLESKTLRPLAWLENQTLMGSRYRLSFSRDGTRLIAQSADNSLYIWELAYIKDELSKMGLCW